MGPKEGVSSCTHASGTGGRATGHLSDIVQLELGEKGQELRHKLQVTQTVSEPRRWERHCHCHGGEVGTVGMGTGLTFPHAVSSISCLTPPLS